jgi:hypothetical protein
MEEGISVVALFAIIKGQSLTTKASLTTTSFRLCLAQSNWRGQPLLPVDVPVGLMLG